MKTPADLGLPPKFHSWRKGQERTVRELLYTRDRFTLLVPPTGSGKTVTAMSSIAADVDDGQSRSLYLTATKQLQDQVLEDFESMGMVDIRGRANYVCNIDETKMANEAVCTGGAYCDRMKGGGCDFYDQRRDAGEAAIVLSNYAFRLHDEDSKALGHFNQLILDEAHRAPEQIESYAAVRITDKECVEYGIPKPDRDQDRWKIAALDQLQRVLFERRPASGDRVSFRHVQWMRGAVELKRKLTRLCRLSDHEWLFSRMGRYGWRWDLLDPSALAEDLLFRGAKKVVFVSATANKKTLEILGVDGDNVTVIEQESLFPVSRRPIYFWPVARVSYTMDALSKRRHREAIDEFLSKRRDRKGLIDSVSYERGRQIVRESRYSADDFFLLHEDGEPTERFVERFKARKGPTWAVSPAMAEGVDLPLDLCEFVLIPKMPFPKTTDPLVKAKKKRDKDYIPYITLQRVMQVSGRGMRTPKDQCETVILDQHFAWLRAGYGHYLRRWFSAAVRTVAARDRCPDPLPKL